MDESLDKSYSVSHRIVISGVGFFYSYLRASIKSLNFGTGKLPVTVEPVRLDAFGAKDIFYIHKIYLAFFGDCSVLKVSCKTGELCYVRLLRD